MARDEHNKAAEHHESAANPIALRPNTTARAITQRARSTHPLPNNTPKPLANTASKRTPRISSRSKQKARQ